MADSTLHLKVISYHLHAIYEAPPLRHYKRLPQMMAPLAPSGAKVCLKATLHKLIDMRLRYLLLTLGVAWPALACSCSSYDQVKACEIAQGTPVIFRGRVIDDNDARTGGFGKPTLYRFKVLEGFKGLPTGMKEVFIDPGSMTSCRNEFARDHDYLVYAGIDRPIPTVIAGFSGLRAYSRENSIPTAWKGLERLPVYSVPLCNPTRRLVGQDVDLDYLRSFVTGNPQGNGWIEGRAVQNFSWPNRSAEFIAAPDAILTATSLSGDQLSIRAQADGTFKIDSVPPGGYVISARSALLGTGKRPLSAATVEVPQRGCVVANFSFETQSTISGKVLDSYGKPASNVRLELGELLPGNSKVRIIPGTWTETDQDGNFKISNVPMAPIALAANLNGAPTARMPFDTVYVPGTQSVSAAKVFAIRPGEQLMGVTLRLPTALPFGDLYVDVKWPDGAPAVGDVRASAEWNGAQADYEIAPRGTNRVKLRLALGRKYKIGVIWFDSRSGKSPSVEGASPKTIDFTNDGQTLELRLKDPRPR